MSEARAQSGPAETTADDGALEAVESHAAAPDAPETVQNGQTPETEGEVTPTPTRRRGLRSLLPAPVWHVGRLLILALIIEYLVVPQIAGTRNAVHQLANVHWPWLLLGVVLEMASILSYAQLARTLLPPESRPSLFTVLRIQLTTLSVSHCVPGGSAAGSSLGYRLLTNAGVRGADVGFALATQSLGSAVVLNVIFWAALVVSIPVWGFSAPYLTAAAVGAVLLAFLATMVWVLTRGEDRAANWIERKAARIPFVDAAAMRAAFVRVSFRLRDLGKQRRLLRWATLWAACNWLLDAASLFVFVGAFGHWVNPDGLLVAFGLAYVLAAIPITPGGLGVVEATLTSTLVGFGTPRSVAILGVVSYRLVNFWLPIPLGGITYASLHVDSGNPERLPGRIRQAAGRLRRRHRSAGTEVPTPDG
ncbi:MAG: UPF0104 family protein [Acidimicrobiaceae bacterium]|nr:UPF0104 family protein [Acidimicrobiaceae bacterium]